MFLLTSLALACTITLDAPAAQSQTLGVPTFRWTTDCPTTRLQLRASDVSTVVLSEDFTSERTFTPDPAFWAGLAEGRYRWRVTDGAGTFATQVFWLDRDDDGDGVSVLRGQDCDDTDGDRFPGNPERCDGLDQDCDAEADEGAVGGWATGAGGDRDLSAALLSGSFGAPSIVPVGDEVVTLCPGTYAARLEATGAVDVEGQGATLATGSGPAVDVLGGATFHAANLDLVDGTGFGGGLRCTDGTVTLTDGVVTGHLTGSAVSTLRCDLTLERVDVADNVSPQGGGGLRIESGTVHLIDSSIHDNTCSVNGGGLELVGSDGTCERSSLVGNTAGDGGAAYLIDGSLAMDACDLGVPATPQENLPADILTYTPSTYATRHYAAGDGVTNACARTGVCGTSVTVAPSTPTWQLEPGAFLGRVVGSLRLEEVSVLARTEIVGANCTGFMQLVDRSGALIASTPTFPISAFGTEFRVSGLDMALPVQIDDTYSAVVTSGCDVGGVQLSLGAIPGVFDGATATSVTITRL